MKRWKLVEIITNYIYHDNIFLMPPNVDWYLMNVLNKHIKDSYHKIRPLLLFWQGRGYITLIEDDKTIFIIHPEKLPTKEELVEESKNYIQNNS